MSIAASAHTLDVGVNIVGNLGSADKLGPMLHECTLEGWEGTLGVSLTSVFLTMKHELKQMMRHGLTIPVDGGWAVR